MEANDDKLLSELRSLRTSLSMRIETLEHDGARLSKLKLTETNIKAAIACVESSLREVEAAIRDLSPRSPV